MSNYSALIVKSRRRALILGDGAVHVVTKDHAVRHEAIGVTSSASPPYLRRWGAAEVATSMISGPKKTCAKSGSAGRSAGSCETRHAPALASHRWRYRSLSARGQAAGRARRRRRATPRWPAWRQTGQHLERIPADVGPPDGVLGGAERSGVGAEGSCSKRPGLPLSAGGCGRRANGHRVHGLRHRFGPLDRLHHSSIERCYHGFVAGVERTANFRIIRDSCRFFCSLRLAVRTLASHVGNRG